jgi:N-sulfoglucosamine sulfohydrolase
VNPSILPLVRSARAVSLAIFAWLPDAAIASEKASPLNLFFILTEDQGAHFGHAGTPGIETPHMDSLARAGVYFENAFVAYPVCSASKASIFTGLHNHTNGILNNTRNVAKLAADVTDQDRKSALYRNNRIHDNFPTLIERLHAAGYYQGFTHKLHVLPVEKFPYDEFDKNTGGRAVAGFLRRAKASGKPWHLFYNIPNSHRPYPNSDKKPIRVNPADVKPPPYLPDTPIVRKDWAEYLAAIEATDSIVGEGLRALRESGEYENTLVVFMGDHGPTFARGKMSLHDLGLRVPLAISGPGIPRGVRSTALASGVDITPTLLDILGLPPLPNAHGISLRGVIEGGGGATKRDFVFAEISNRGHSARNNMQERAVSDGRWKLIYREDTSSGWRQVNEDTIQWPTWGNRSYAETVKRKAEFPEAFRILAEMHPQQLGGTVPTLEFYDLQNDPFEMKNLAASTRHRPELVRLYNALRRWVESTADPSVNPPPEPPTHHG